MLSLHDLRRRRALGLDTLELGALGGALDESRDLDDLRRARYRDARTAR